ncbi:MAG: HEPN domain-containing protein [Methanoregula sp.]|uniref:HEPN domain-containing protein n=1 Tax=Methanoregula sp. TaxID=2052170 RepID=UPI003BAF895D
MIEDLEREGLIKRLPYDKKKVDDSLALAYRDLRTSRTILPTDRDWAYTIAYNAVLQAGRALMFAKGYRPDGASQHIAVVKFVELFVEPHDAIIFDRMRRKRHSSVYDTAGSISETEAESAVGHAEHLIRKIEEII